MEKNGSVSYGEVENALAVAGTCGKLTEFTSFVDCRYEKAKQSCSNLPGISCCPVPMPPVRYALALCLLLAACDVASVDGDAAAPGDEAALRAAEAAPPIPPVVSATDSGG